MMMCLCLAWWRRATVATFCDQPISFSEEYVVDLEGNSTRYQSARLKLVYKSIVLGSSFKG